MIRMHHLPLLICLGLATLVAGAEYVVAPDGDDANPGTEQAPWRSVAKAVERSRGGDVITLRAGLYRERVDYHAKRHSGSEDAPTTLRAWPGETVVLSGADAVTDWERHEGAIWKKTGWTTRSQQVFVDFDRTPSHGLQQIGANGADNDSFRRKVGSGLDDMIPGSFFHDPEAAVLYVWLADGGDPNQHTVELSVREAVIQTHLFEGDARASWFHFEGLSVRHGNSSTRDQFGSMMSVGYNSTVRDCRVTHGDFGGIELAGGVVIEDCEVSDNGGIGISVRGHHGGWTVRRCTVERNNHRLFYTGHHAGGMKCIPKAWGTVEDSVFAHNIGSGVWFDWCLAGKPIVIRNNRIHDNQGDETDGGIKIEGSNEVTITGNVLARNSGNGVLVFASDRVEVAHNTLVGGSGMAAIQVGGVPRDNRTTSEVDIHDNIIADHHSTYDLLIQQPGGPMKPVASDHNLFFRPGVGLRNSMGGTYAGGMGHVTGDLEAWRRASGKDAASILADPGFVDPAADDFRLASGSPALGAAADGSDLGALTGAVSSAPVGRPTSDASDGEATVWFDDHLPVGVVGGLQQKWKKEKPLRFWTFTDQDPHSGRYAAQILAGSRPTQILFTDAAEGFPLGADEALELHLWLDPTDPPGAVIVQVGDAGTRDEGLINTRHWPGRHWGSTPFDSWPTTDAGAVPVAGEWVALRLPASELGLDGPLHRFAVTIDRGQARIDLVRRVPAGR